MDEGDANAARIAGKRGNPRAFYRPYPHPLKNENLRPEAAVAFALPEMIKQASAHPHQEEKAKRDVDLSWGNWSAGRFFAWLRHSHISAFGDIRVVSQQNAIGVIAGEHATLDAQRGTASMPAPLGFIFITVQRWTHPSQLGCGFAILILWKKQANDRRPLRPDQQTCERMFQVSAMGPCVDGSGLARVFFTHAAVVGAAMCSAC
ncbi:hypothetical protein [Bradyrhizobium arachidis]|uniref:hypothetical protein n=1 Tax=Bradyrhizobium arachidis TaxID=858423 RepID=UPI0021616164|nr:hypothetical protein [Bradyrhizobium arachidis]UVO27044.1 hypothetical protein KUF59_31600 [Bradyrhizobium arachidis]